MFAIGYASGYDGLDLMAKPRLGSPLSSRPTFDPEEMYIAVSGKLTYAGEGQLWLADPSRGRLLAVSEEAGTLLRVADRFRTLREHRRALLALGWQDDGSGSLDALLASLVTSRALRPRREFLRRLQEAPVEADPPRLGTIAWVTRDRPELLRRSVKSAVANLRLHERQADLKVFDDSADPPARQATREMLAELGRREGVTIRYAGEEEKRAFASRLLDRAVSYGVSADLVEFALFDPFHLGDTPGANSNAVLLDTCGTLVLHADDDSVFRFAAPAETARGIALSSAADPTQVRFFEDRAARERDVPLADQDILSIHEAYLGRTAAACLQPFAGQVDCDEMAPELLPILESGDARVAATMAGVCGDSGMGSALFVLWLTGRSRELALQSEESYQQAVSSREILRLASKPTLSRSPFLMSMHLGLDNRLLLPPFLPVLRNGDGLFGNLVKVSLPYAFTAFLDRAAEHVPGQRRSFAPTEVQSSTVRAADLILALLVFSEVGVSLKAVGEGIAGFARLPLTKLQGVLREAWAVRMSRYIASLELLLGEHEQKPVYWAIDAALWIRSVKDQVASEAELVPTDLGSLNGLDAMEAFRRLLFVYGELLQAWSIIRSSAADLIQAGTRLSNPL